MQFLRWVYTQILSLIHNMLLPAVVSPHPQAPQSAPSVPYMGRIKQESSQSDGRLKLLVTQMQPNYM